MSTTPPGARICHINLADGFRGGERQTELLVRELARRDWRQRLVARRGGALAERCRDIPGLEIAEVTPNPVAAALAARGCSIVHAHEARAVYSGWLLRRLAKTPFVLTRRIDHAARRSRMRARAYRSASKVVALSTSIARTVEAQYPDIVCEIVPSAHANMASGGPEGGLSPRQDGAQHDSMNGVRNGSGNCLQNGSRTGLSTVSGNGRTVIGHIGELDHSHKGQGTILAAARALQHSHPNLRFVLVGRGKDAHRFRSEAIDLDNVEFPGFVENVADCLATFDVFVYPSLHEGLGSSLLDAMHFGLPIVASNVGGIPEIVEHEVNGLLISPGSAPELVAAIQRVVTEPELRESMARENRRKAAFFSAARMASSYETIYRAILDGAD